ncbi:MAG: protein kinase [Clostridia bacterium]|nr:protein kinase [Clostridia bacterium]
MNIRGYEIVKDWELSSAGHTAIGEKGGKRYFLKKYNQYKIPKRGEGTSESLYAKKLKEFEEFKENRIAINNALASFAGPGGNVILPSEWFDDGTYYIEATEFVKDVVATADIYRLSLDEIKFIMLTAAGALGGVHRKNIVHSDLKLTNLLVAKNPAKKYVAKVIDMDKSYFADKIRPDELGGDQSYMSPELTCCLMTELAPEALECLSTKSDIYSLGLIFHNYLTGGDFPKYAGLDEALVAKVNAGEAVYCGEASLYGSTLVVSSKITEKYLSHLIAAMLCLEPEKRPSASEIVDILKSKTVLPIPADSGSAVEGETPLEITEGGRAEEGPSRREDVPTPEPEPVKVMPTGYCAPWPEHNITIVESALGASGYVAMEQETVNGKHCYRVYRANETSRVVTKDHLVGFDWATDNDPKPSKPVRRTGGADLTINAEETDALWEEHEGFKYNMPAVLESGWTGIKRATRNGIRGYVLTKDSGEKRFMVFNTVKMLGFIVKA